MSRKCNLTGTKAQTGNNVSNSNRRTRRIFAPNLQNVTLKSDVLNRSFQMKITTRTLRTITKYGSLDEYLLHTKAKNLTEFAAKLKAELKKNDSIKAKIKAAKNAEVAKVGSATRDHGNGWLRGAAPAPGGPWADLRASTHPPMASPWRCDASPPPDTETRFAGHESPTERGLTFASGLNLKPQLGHFREVPCRAKPASVSGGPGNPKGWRGVLFPGASLLAGTERGQRQSPPGDSRHCRLPWFRAAPPTRSTRSPRLKGSLPLRASASPR